MINTSTAIGFLLINYIINIFYNSKESGLYFFKTNQFRKETRSFFIIALIMAFFFS
jgi:hypothetical protein